MSDAGQSAVPAAGLTKKVNVNEVVRTLIAVKMTPRCWSGSMVANDAAREVEQSHKADSGTVGAKVYLLPETLDKELGRTESQLRTEWKRQTRPWEDGGWRVVPATGFLDLLERVREPKAAYLAVCDRLVSEYDQIKAQAKARLNGLFDEARFPSREAMQSKCGVDIASRPITTADDVRIVGLSESAFEMVKQSVDADNAERLAGAVQSIGDELAGLVSALLEKIEAARNGDNFVVGKLVKAADRTCNALAGLNLTNDPKVFECIDRVERLIRTVTVDDLKSGGKRVDVLEKDATAILSDINAVFGGAA